MSSYPLATFNTYLYAQVIVPSVLELSGMDYDTWLQSAQFQLAKAKIPTARLDALLLLVFVTNKSKAHLLAHGDTQLTKTEEASLSVLLNRRLTFEPIAYIIGRKEFYGRDFTVTQYVLVPRPESEDSITLLLEQPAPKTIIDIGTGSGALAITAKLELPSATVYATDVDTACLKVARHNAEALQADINFMESDLLMAINPSIIKDSVILANLPYVPQDYPLNNDAMHEPESAIFSQENGLMHYRRLFTQLQDTNNIPAAIICESLEQQQTALATLALDHGFAHIKTLGLQQLFTIK